VMKWQGPMQLVSRSRDMRQLGDEGGSPADACVVHPDRYLWGWLAPMHLKSQIARQSLSLAACSYSSRNRRRGQFESERSQRSFKMLGMRVKFLGVRT
jgi:hypothetical protein